MSSEHAGRGGGGLRVGMTSGSVAGLVIGWRSMAMVFDATGSSSPLADMAWPALMVVTHVAAGVVLGALAALTIRLLIRLGLPTGSMTTAVPVVAAAGAVLVVAGGLSAGEPMPGFVELLVLTLLVMAALFVAPDRLTAPDGGLTVLTRLLLGTLLGGLAVFGLAGWSSGAGTGGFLAALMVGTLVALGFMILHRKAAETGAAGAIAIGAAIFLALGAVAGVQWSLGLPRPSIPPAAEAQVPDTPNVILISVDTLRADAVGYAGGRARTPNLDRLADQSRVFTRAYSTAPWTRPSFASFFSSRYPYELGVARSLGVPGESAAITPYTWQIDAPTAIEQFQEAGYATGAVATNWNLTSQAGAARGFDAFLHVSQAMMSPQVRETSLTIIDDLLGPVAPVGLRHAHNLEELERADDVQAGAEQMIAALPARPSLLWVHYMDPHEPYDAPGADAELQIDPEKPETMAAIDVRTAPEREVYQRAYAAEIEYFDRWLGALIDELRSAGMWDDAVVVFWSDHGEEFWDHGSWEHGHTLYNEQVHVPLLIRAPGAVSGASQEPVTDPVSLLDVMPTVLDLCGLEPGEQMRGRSLSPLLKPGAGQVEEFELFLEACVWGSVRKGVMDERYKLIHDLSDDSYRLYDLEEDPGEQHNLAGTGQVPEEAALRERLASFTETSLAAMAEYTREGADSGMSEEIRERLRDMGYIQ